jgi:hypothetical protein
MAVTVTALMLTAADTIAVRGQDRSAAVQPADVQKLAEDAFTFAFPMLEQYRTMLSEVTDQQTGNVMLDRFNRFQHREQLADANSRFVVRPNNDTLYSLGWLDLRAEPVVIHTPPIPGTRYWSIQIVDAYTHNPAIFGVRTGSQPNAPHDYLIAGPQWSGQGSGGITSVVKLETEFALAFVRIAVYEPGDVLNVRRLQQGFTIRPLHGVTGRPAPRDPAPLRFPVFDAQRANGAGFIEYFNFLLSQVQPNASEAALIAGWAPIGVGAGRAPAAMTAQLRESIDAGVRMALSKIEQREALGAAPHGSWIGVSDSFGNRDRMQGRYLVRAAAAKLGLYGLDREEAEYLGVTVDATNQRLDGSAHSYSLRFDKAHMPPARAFWSLVVYDESGFFVANPINRYSIGDRTQGLSYGDDGSLTVYIQNSPPGGERAANWLPAPDGPFSLALRLYYPVGTDNYAPPVPEVTR